MELLHRTKACLLYTSGLGYIWGKTLKPGLRVFDVRYTKRDITCLLYTSGEEQANSLLSGLIQNHITVVTFDLREPSLHEIFVEKVGEEHE